MEELLAGLDPAYGKLVKEWESVLLEVGGEEHDVECGVAGFVSGLMIGAYYAKGEALGQAMMVLLVEGIKAESRKRPE